MPKVKKGMHVAASIFADAAGHPKTSNKRMSDSSDRINELFAKEDWRKARTVIERELKKTPLDHWLLARLATIFYEEREYAAALKFAEQARALAPRCPLVLWEQAGALQMLGKPKQALKVYACLLSQDFTSLADDECGEGVDWAIALLADCAFRAATCWEDLEQTELALSYLSTCLEGKAMGAGGIYSKQDVEREINKLVKTNRRVYLEQNRERLAQLSAGC